VGSRGLPAWQGGAPPPVAPTLSERPKCAQDPCQPRPGLDPHVCPGCASLPVRRLHTLLQQRGCLSEVATGPVGLPQGIRRLRQHGAIADLDRQLDGLPARRNGTVVVSCRPEYSVGCAVDIEAASHGKDSVSSHGTRLSYPRRCRSIP
jgi:hypothetical protein